MGRAVVVGRAATGEAVGRVLAAEGWVVDVGDDRDPGTVDWAALVEGADLVVPSPGVAPGHPALAAAARQGVTVRSEVDLAAQRCAVPFVAVTGTNGKSTVTEMVSAMLTAAGLTAPAVGNIGRPFLDAVAAGGADAFVVEVSSFQLAHTGAWFRPLVAVVLAVAPDHLDWHGSFEHYVAAKARIVAAQDDGDLCVYDADDEVATDIAARGRAPAVGCTLAPVPGAYHVDANGSLVDQAGEVVAEASDLWRALPHDRKNALAAIAAARHAGCTAEHARAAVRAFAGLPHRVALVSDAGGVRYYDDSKATNPHAAIHAVRSFPSVVWIAGGRNKGLDLGALTEAADHVKAVVALGEAADEVAAAFEGVRPVRRAATMRDAVAAAAEIARPGDVVLLSPGCASFDAYPSYAARGDDFAREVRAVTGAPA
jgi:UDP-N-acetylmuramoylalanine--D-glutamate ligase